MALQSLGPKTGKAKVKASELQYHGNEATGRDLERSIVASHEGRIIGFLKSEAPQRAANMHSAAGGTTHENRKLSLAWVHPDYQRKGVASTMVGLERSRTGYTPIGDTALSPAGQKFQRGSGVPTNPKGELVSRRIGDAMAGARQQDVQRLQQHVLAGAQFDPLLVKLTAPYKAPRRKREPAPVQGQLFDPTNY